MYRVHPVGLLSSSLLSLHAFHNMLLLGRCSTTFPYVSRIPFLSNFPVAPLGNSFRCRKIFTGNGTYRSGHGIQKCSEVKDRNKNDTSIDVCVRTSPTSDPCMCQWSVEANKIPEKNQTEHNKNTTTKIVNCAAHSRIMGEGEVEG